MYDSQFLDVSGPKFWVPRFLSVMSFSSDFEGHVLDTRFGSSGGTEVVRDNARDMQHPVFSIQYRYDALSIKYLPRRFL